MSVSRSVSNSLSRSTSRSLGLARGSSSASAFSPLSLSGLRQYALDGGESYHDSTVGGYPVLRSLEPYGTHRQPRQGRCWLFDGVNDYGDAGTGIGNTLGASASALTFTTWVKINSINNDGIFDISAFNSSSAVFSVSVASASLRVRIGGVVSISYAPALATWIHVAVSFGSGIYSLYVNGELQSSVSGLSTLDFSGLKTIVGAYYGGGFCLDGSLRDLRVFSTAKTAPEILAIKNGDDDATGLLAHYPCNEESGTTGYDISGNSNHLTLTNITQATFHATDTAVTSNRNNESGYRLSGSVYIPKRLSDANAADGNALTVTGQSPYPINVEVPCVTGNGSTVYCDLGSPLIPATADFELSLWYYHVANEVATKAVVAQRGSSTPNGFFAVKANADAAGESSGSLALFVYSGSPLAVVIGGVLVAATWHRIVVTRVSNLWTLKLTPVGGSESTSSDSSPQSVYVGADLELLRDSSAGGTQYNNGRITDFRITTGGVTTYFPLQDGPGSSNTNRDLSYVKSDGTYGVVSGAIVNGTVSTIWANRCPYAEDWSVNYGGDIAASGAFLPGQISGSLAADGTAKTLDAGKFGNPYSRVNFNAFTAAELNGLGAETAYAVGTARQSVSPTDTKFRRFSITGDDRLITVGTALTGTDKTNTEGYVFAEDADALAYIAAVEAADTEALEAGVKSAINDFVMGCKNDGIWDAIKASCILAGARTLTGCLVPLKGTAPTNNGPFVSGDYNRKTGLVGDGSTKYLNSNRAGNADPQDNFHAFAWLPTQTLASQDVPRQIIASVGNTWVGYNTASVLVGSNSQYFIRARQASSSTISFAANNIIKAVGVSRSTSSSITGRADGVNTNFSIASTTAGTPSFFVLAANDGTSAIQHSPARLAFYSIGESLNLALLDARVSTLITAIDGAI